MQLLDGKLLASQIQNQLISRVQKLNFVPKLVIVQVGEDPASLKYVSLKQKKGLELGIDVIIHHFSESIKQNELLDFIQKANLDTSIHGLMVQLPLPPHLNRDQVLEAISPTKDADGLTPNSRCLPAAVAGILNLLKQYQITVRGKNTIIINDSKLVGLPLSAQFTQDGAIVTVLNKHTPDILPYTQKADILISATGVPNLITGNHIKTGCVVIDVGYPSDVDFATVAPKASFLTPNPGGVGPMTIISLFDNLLDLVDNITNAHKTL